MFEGRAITGAEIVDLLHDEDLYPSQDFAWELVGNVWDQIQRRAGWIGKSYPIRSRGLRLESLGKWSKYVGYSFCLVLSLAECYPKWAQQPSHDYLEQGELFEAFTGECLSNLLDGWSVHQTGWTRKKAKQLPQVVSEVATLLGKNSAIFLGGRLRMPTRRVWTSSASDLSQIVELAYRRICSNAPAARTGRANGKPPIWESGRRLSSLPLIQTRLFRSPSPCRKKSFGAVALPCRGCCWTAIDCWSQAVISESGSRRVFQKDCSHGRMRALASCRSSDAAGILLFRPHA